MGARRRIALATVLLASVGGGYLNNNDGEKGSIEHFPKINNPELTKYIEPETSQREIDDKDIIEKNIAKRAIKLAKKGDPSKVGDTYIKLALKTVNKIDDEGAVTKTNARDPIEKLAKEAAIEQSQDGKILYAENFAANIDNSGEVRQVDTMDEIR